MVNIRKINNQLIYSHFRLPSSPKTMLIAETNIKAVYCNYFAHNLIYETGVLLTPNNTYPQLILAILVTTLLMGEEGLEFCLHVNIDIFFLVSALFF